MCGDLVCWVVGGLVWFVLVVFFLVFVCVWLDVVGVGC